MPYLNANNEEDEFIDNEPTGIAFKRYQYVWLNFLDDLSELTGSAYGTRSDAESLELKRQYREQLKKEGYEGMNIITKETLPQFFGGLITSWPELIKILKAFQKSEFKYPIEDAFIFEYINDDTVILKLKKVTPAIAKKYDTA